MNAYTALLLSSPLRPMRQQSTLILMAGKPTKVEARPVRPPEHAVPVAPLKLLEMRQLFCFQRLGLRRTSVCIITEAMKNAAVCNAAVTRIKSVSTSPQKHSRKHDHQSGYASTDLPSCSCAGYIEAL